MSRSYSWLTICSLDVNIDTLLKSCSHDLQGRWSLCWLWREWLLLSMSRQTAWDPGKRQSCIGIWLILVCQTDLMTEEEGDRKRIRFQGYEIDVKRRGSQMHSAEEQEWGEEEEEEEEGSDWKRLKIMFWEWGWSFPSSLFSLSLPSLLLPQDKIWFHVRKSKEQPVQGRKSLNLKLCCL